MEVCNNINNNILYYDNNINIIKTHQASLNELTTTIQKLMGKMKYFPVSSIFGEISNDALLFY